MDLSKIKSIISNPDHFVIDRGIGGQHKVPKRMITDPAVLANMESAARGHAAAAQAIASKAEAGGVTRAADGAINDPASEYDAVVNDPRTPPPKRYTGESAPPLKTDTSIVDDGTPADGGNASKKTLGFVQSDADRLHSQESEPVIESVTIAPQGTAPTDAGFTPAATGDGGQSQTPDQSFPGGLEAAKDAVYAERLKNYPSSPGTREEAWSKWIDQYDAHTAAEEAAKGDIFGTGGAPAPTLPASLNAWPTPAKSPAVPGVSAGGESAPDQLPRIEVTKRPDAPTTPAPGVEGSPAAPATTVNDPRLAAMDKATRAHENVLRQVAANGAALSQAQQKILDDANKERVERAQQVQARVVQNTRDGKAISDWIRDNPVEPNRIFHDAGVGGMFATFIGSILGGIGGALTHSPNEFWQVANAAIDRDVKAQENARAGAETRLNYYRKQGYDIVNAAKLAAADNIDKVNGLLAANVNRYNAPTKDAQGNIVPGAAANAAQQAITAGQQLALQKRLDAQGEIAKINGYHADQLRQDELLKYKRWEIENQQRAQASTDAHHQAILDAVRGQGAGDPLQAVGKAALLTSPDLPKHLVRVPRTAIDPSTGEETVLLDRHGEPLRSTEMALTPTPDKLREEVTTWENENAMQRAWGSFLKDHPNGSWSPEVLAGWKATRYPGILAMLQTVANRTTQPEIEAFEQAVDNPASASNTIFKTGQAAFNVFQKAHYNRLRSLRGQLYQ